MSLVSLAFLGVTACRDKPVPTPDKAPSPSASAPLPAPTTSAASAKTPEGIPTFTLEELPFAEGMTKPYAVEGAILGFLEKDQRIGRIAEDHIEWSKGRIPPETPAYGKNMLISVHGSWPDGIDALYQNTSGRAPAPTYFPVTGKGVSHTIASGGGYGHIAGVVKVGASTLLIGDSMLDGVEIVTVRGPQLSRKPLSPEKAGCKPGEVRKRDYPPKPPRSCLMLPAPPHRAPW
ncbi:Hypothetical protein A7982_06500 [Minicystis rosea]|nr:Hypothetical protein A7982_06500 [Minicystis rosea]